LSFFSITVEAFRIAGGLLITRVGFEMLQGKRKKLKTEAVNKEAKQKQDVSIVPLAIPMLSGPGALTTALVLMESTQSFLHIGALFLAIITVCVLSYFILIEAVKVDRYLGATGKLVVEKIMGLIVVVVGIQFLINGLQALLVLWNIL